MAISAMLPGVVGSFRAGEASFEEHRSLGTCRRPIV